MTNTTATMLSPGHGSSICARAAGALPHQPRNLFPLHPEAVKDDYRFGKGGDRLVLLVTSPNLGPVVASAFAGPLSFGG